MSEFISGEPAAQSSEPDTVIARLVLEIAGPPDEVRQSIDAVHTLAGLLGIRAVQEETSSKTGLVSPSERPVDEAEVELHRKLDQSVEPLLRRHTFGEDRMRQPPRSNHESRLISLTGKALRRGGVQTLRDLLVVGAYYVRQDIRHVGPKGYALITAAVASELGPEVEWLEYPLPRDVARWCVSVDQITGVVISGRHWTKTLGDLIELGDEDAQKYASAFLAARQRLVEVWQSRTQ